ncbi:MAG: GMC family oxidoreductase, partial [Myxococcota bacterium]
TQGHEVIGLRKEGLKFEALGFGLGVLATRLEGVGQPFAAQLDQMAHWLDWGVAVRANAEGRVRLVRGRPVVQFAPSAEDIRRFRRGVQVLGQMMFAAGAQEILPGVQGLARHMTHPDQLRSIEAEGPRHPAAYTAAITHMFGTARMGSDPDHSVVRPDFRHHAVDRLYIADSSVFPSNLGVNPQLPIMAMAALCGQRIARTLPVAGRLRHVNGTTTNGHHHHPSTAKLTHPITLPTELADRVQPPHPPEQPTTPPSPHHLTLDDLMAMDAAQLWRVFRHG